MTTAPAAMAPVSFRESMENSLSMGLQRVCGPPHRPRYDGAMRLLCERATLTEFRPCFVESTADQAPGPDACWMCRHWHSRPGISVVGAALRRAAREVR